MVETIGNGRMTRAKTPSGRRQRAVALSAAVMESGRQAAGKKLADEKFERKLDGLPKVKVRKMTDDEVVELKGRAVFHRGSAEHRVELPKVDEGKDVKRRVWCGVIGDDGCGMDIVDKNMGVKVENHQIWLTPRKDSLEKLGKGGSLQWTFDLMGVMESHSGVMTTRRKDGKRIAVLDGKGSKCTIVGTQVKLFGRGLVTNMRGVEKHPKQKRKDFVKCMDKLENLLKEWLGPVTLRTMKATQDSNDVIGMSLGGKKKSEVHCSMAVGRNVFLCVHTDDDAVLGVVQVIGEEGADWLGDEVLAHFCFPSLGRCTAMRSGDTLIFDSQLPHCVSSRVNGNGNMCCVSLHVNCLVPGGKDNRTAEEKAEEKAKEKKGNMDSEEGTKKGGK